MKVLNIIIVVSTLLMMNSCKSKSKASKIDSNSISLKIEYTEQYCGGAAPSPEMEEAMSTERPYSNKPVYISKFINPITFTDEKKVMLDKGGIGSVDLDTGMYVISFYKLAGLGVAPVAPQPTKVLENQKENEETGEPNPETVDIAMKADCEMRWKRMSAFPFKVIGGKTAYAFPMMKECNPCEEPRP